MVEKWQVQRQPGRPRLPGVPRTFKAHLVGFMGLGNELGEPYEGEDIVAPGVVLRLPNGRKRVLLSRALRDEVADGEVSKKFPQVQPRTGAGSPWRMLNRACQERARRARGAARRRAWVKVAHVLARGGGAASITRAPGSCRRRFMAAVCQSRRSAAAPAGAARC